MEATLRKTILSHHHLYLRSVHSFPLHLDLAAVLQHLRLESAMDSLLTAKLSDGTWSACPRALLEAEDTKLKAGRSPNHNLRCKRVGQHAVQATPGVIRKGEMLQGKGGCKRTRARKGRAGVPSFVFHFCKMRVLEEMVSLEFLRPVRYTRPMSEAHKRERKKSGKD